jgi:hypothetical protein
MVQRCDDVDRMRGDTEEGKGRRYVSWFDVNLTGPKNKENTCDRFSWYKWMNDEDLKSDELI